MRKGRDSVMEEEGKSRGTRGGEGRDFKVIFWNMAQLWNKDREFWSGLRNSDVITLTETCDKKELSRIRRGCRRLCMGFTRGR